jgi:hypothetical protein
MINVGVNSYQVMGRHEARSNDVSVIHSASEDRTLK